MTKPPDQRSGKVRCSSKLIPPAAVEYLLFIEKVMPSLLFEKNADSASITAEAFGVQAGCICAASEKGWMASLRMAVTGTKTVMVCSARSAHALFGTKDPTSWWQDLMQIKDSDMVLNIVVLQCGREQLGQRRYFTFHQAGYSQRRSWTRWTLWALS